MTTEERFTRIENALQALTENQAREEGAIRDLIVVSRTLLESQKQTTTQIQDLGHALKAGFAESANADRRLGERLDSVAEKLDALIAVVEHSIRRIDRSS